jgi:dTDP-4-dehydrorhamnose reductase
MTIWVIGSNGFLGQHLVKKLQNEKSIFSTSSRNGFDADEKLDLVDSSTYKNVNCSPSDFVILLAGVSSPEECHQQYDSAYKVNVAGTTAFIEYVLSRGARLLFASSDTVYGNRQEPVDESAKCSPHGEYGQMKHEIEISFFSNPNFMSFRLSYIFADNDKFTTFLKSQSLSDKTAKAFVDFYRNSVDVEDVLEGLVKVCQNWGKLPSPRIINFCGPAPLSRFELANQINQKLGLNLSIQGEYAPEGFFDSRPRIINLINQKFTNLLAL